MLQILDAAWAVGLIETDQAEAWAARELARRGRYYGLSVLPPRLWGRCPR